MKTNRLKNEMAVTRAQNQKSGVVLIVIVLIVASIAALGVAAITVSSEAMQSRITAGYASRAYYLAESGAEYAKVERQKDPTALPNGTYTLEGGDQILLSSAATTNGVRVDSTGIANPGSSIEARRRITFLVFDTGGDDVVPVGFDFDEDGEFDDENWNLVGLKKATIADTGPSGGEPALDLQGTVGSIELNWQDNPDLDLAQAWANNGQLLCYELQMKVSPFDTGNEQAFSHHFMLGLSFRLYPDTNTSYGISFFRSRLVTDSGKSDPAPAWMPADLSPLRGTNVYLVLWYRNNAVFDLMNYKKLDESNGMATLTKGKYELRDYSTILLKLEEQFDVNDQRENHISVYLQNVDVYPNWNSPSDKRWSDDTATFPAPVQWDDPVTVDNVDSRLTSANFDLIRPAEVAVHVYYDQAGANKKFFDDFGMKVKGFGGGVNGQDQIQY